MYEDRCNENINNFRLIFYLLFQIVVYRTEHEYIIPLAQQEVFPKPTPVPRSRSRSRSQISPLTDDDRTSRGADSIAFDDGSKYVIEMKETNGFVIRN